MEVGEGGEERQTPAAPAADGWKKPPPEGGEKPPKRKMKTPYQLEILEKTYAVETYPSEALRAELSVKTGLSDRQLQMWFCHRRLKDRKFPPTKRQRKEEESLPLTPPPPVLPPQSEMVSSESGGVGGLSSSPFSAGLGSSGESRRPVSRTAILSRIGTDMSAVGRRYYDPQGLPPPPQTHLTMAELRILESVESQLGEPLRQDGPVLGIEFDPLPPGAFGAPIEMPVQQKQPMRPYDSIMFERHDTKTGKAANFLPGMEHLLPSSSSAKRKPTAGGSHMVHPHMGPRALHEYQFLPEQPTVRSEAYDRVSQSHYYDSSVDTSSARIHSGVKSLHRNDQEAPGYTFQGQMPSASHLSQQGRQQNFPSSMDPDGAPSSNSFPVPAADAQFGMHQGIEIENAYLSSDRRIHRDEDFSRLERKRKSDEARIAKEVEAHEKRIRKELEKQDILRRKREEQMRKEMEKHDRERRKEEERVMREKQREEERFQREQQRENQRREKFLLKESRRAEKLRQKEELRREKEAARQKAATERATARRIAREYMELIEDERLELMELAAANRGFSSIFAVDSDTLQQLDSFRSLLCSFPPTSVRLRRPFAIRPWADSDENIANLLMVWKFLITFADVLGLWPFTLDEFVQSLHDYDSRLLGEIHVTLLKSIIKNIEDVARTPATTTGASQSGSANPGGGHPHIVEGAYAWGFNIRSWQLHLNYLTWPEILRQFALSAGFGPQLKKRNAERVYLRDENEGNDGEDVISTLRNGSAVENAVALMQERGYTNRRRSRHRLTPGTVKFAAFHVLSLEGSRGLTILEVADKIQKSGLRDLTTSKTPEASIAAALSRDTKLFERTAPSTYCVKSPYRKDPVDADSVLSAAREKIQVFQSALSDSEEAEKDTEDVDDAERDEDSEGDVADDPEVEDAGIDAKLDKSDSFANDLRDSRTLVSLGEEKEGETGLTPQNTFGNIENALPVHSSENTKATNISGAAPLPDTSSNCHEAGSADVEETEIDECNFGQPWVQGLSEGDYAELSVEERLNALVALVGVAIEGNSIRVVLEERLEAASALKKQMWAEAQLDKRRFREEYPSRLQGTTSAGCKPEIAQINGMTEGSQTPLDNVDKGNDGNPEASNNEQFLEQNQVNLTNMSMGPELTSSDILPVQHYGYASEKSRSQLKSFIGHKAEQLYVYRSLPLGQDRRRNRYWQFSTSSSPNDPGSGRIFFESKDGHWKLIDSEEAFDNLLAALDTRGIRESHLHSMLQRIETTFKEAIRRNNKSISSTKSVGDHVKRVSKVMPTPDCSVELDSPSSTLCGLASDALENSTSFRIELGRNEIEKNAALGRYQGFLRWMWNECYNPHVLLAMKYGKKRCSELLHTCKSCFQSFLAEERHCSFCHKTFKTFQNSDAVFSEHVSLCEQERNSDPDWKLQFSYSTLPIGIRLLKAQLSIVEVSVPSEALQPFWTEGYRKSWAVKLHSSSCAEELFQILTLLEGAIKKDFLSANFETTAELLSSTRGIVLDIISAHSGSVPVLPWVPDTSAAVGLRLLDLDSSISYMLNQKVESRKEREGDYIKLPSGYAVVNNMQEVEPTGTADQLDYQNEGRWLDSGSGQRSRGRGRGSRGGRGGRGRGRGGRRLKGSGSSSRADLMNENLGIFEKATKKYSRRGGRTRGRGGRRRGRRTVRPRQRSEKRVPTIDKRSLMGSFITPDNITKQHRVEESPESSGGEEEWGIGVAGKTFVEDDDNSGGFESEENGQASGDDYDDQAADSARDDYEESKPTGFLDEDVSDDEEEDGRYMEADEDGEEEDDTDAGGGHGMGAYMDDDDDYEEMRDDEEMRDNAEDIGDGDGEGEGEDIGEAEGNGDEDEGASSYSSEYSD